MNDNTRLFLNGFLISSLALNLNSKIEYNNPETSPRSTKISNSGNVAVGGGFEHKRFSLEARYYTKKDILKNNNDESSDYNRFSIILGYKFVKTKLK
jgi:hypothetical protein